MKNTSDPWASENLHHYHAFLTVLLPGFSKVSEGTSVVFICQAHIAPPSCNNTLFVCFFFFLKEPLLPPAPHPSPQGPAGASSTSSPRVGLGLRLGSTEPCAPLASGIGSKMSLLRPKSWIPEGLAFFVERDWIFLGMLLKGWDLGWGRRAT